MVQIFVVCLRFCRPFFRKCQVASVEEILRRVLVDQIYSLIQSRSFVQGEVMALLEFFKVEYLSFSQFRALLGVHFPPCLFHRAKKYHWLAPRFLSSL